MADYIGKEDAVSVKLIREAGGIPFVKSNNPQIVFSMNTDNAIYGLAQNPHNLSRTTSGSSGGEGGLAAAQCSPLGLGSDIGGSIRSPAAFCGVYGFKPTCYRSSYIGGVVPVPNNSLPQTTIIPSMGPIGSSVNDIKIMTEVLFKAYMHDSLLPPLPFNNDTYNEIVQLRTSRKLKIGYYDTLPLFESSDSIKRAIRIAKEKLEA